MSNFDSFVKKHDYLVCVDSDGCVMDTMNCKHFHCFGPCMVTEWDLEEWKDEILDRWNVINLFSMTRGINRFKGLAMALGEINEKYTKITGIEALQHWADTAPALSNDGVAKAAAEATDLDAKQVLEKALSWSKAVNAAIVELDESLKVPYEGAKEGLAAAHQFADVAMVSSANRDAVEEEWGKFGLLEHTDIVLAQDIGSKAACIAAMPPATVLLRKRMAFTTIPSWSTTKRKVGTRPLLSASASSSPASTLSTALRRSWHSCGIWAAKS